MAEANRKIENLFQGTDPLNREELVTYVNFVLSKVREMALGKAQEAAVKWTEEYFSTSPILPLLRTLSKEGRVDVKVIDYQTTLEAGLAGDLVATVEKLVMETLNRLLIRGGQNPNVDRPHKERKPDENQEEVIGLDVGPGQVLGPADGVPAQVVCEAVEEVGDLVRSLGDHHQLHLLPSQQPLQSSPARGLSLA